MKTEQIVNQLTDKRGQSLNVRLVSTVDCLAAHRGNIVQKVTEMTVISGISFENRIDVREAIAAGERGEVGQLPWGQWKQFPHVIEHKGADYIRLYLPSEAQRNAGFSRPTTVNWTCNGLPIDSNEAIRLCGSKAMSKENAAGCMTVKAQNLAIIS